jgi:hypothetical protein
VNGDDRDDTDVKRWLDSALAGEPPMALDRTEVVREGRRRLRRRRALEATGVAVAVVVTVLGTVLVSGQIGPQPSLPPGTRLSNEAPAQATTTSPATSTSPVPPTPDSTPHSAPPSTPPGEDPRAVRLTDVLDRSRMLADVDLAPVRAQSGPPRFLREESGYMFQADVTGPESGYLTVTIEGTEATGVDCDLMEKAGLIGCENQTLNDVDLAVGRYLFENQSRLRVIALRPEGVIMDITWFADLKDGGDRTSATTTTSPIDEQKLVKIAILPELTLP